MSIVERAVDMFEAAPQPPRKAAPASEPFPPASEIDLIERVIAYEGESGPAEIPAGTPSAPFEQPVTGRSRMVCIDRERLRQQRMLVPDDDRTSIAESFRRIKRHVLANLSSPKAGVGTNLVMITSSLPGEGKTFCAINLAISLAMEIDRTVLLVDADVAKPSVTAALGIRVDGELGLMDVLLDSAIPLSDVICRTDVGTLSVLPAGARHSRATEVLASRAMRELLHETAERYPDRVIIFDSPPLLSASEASVLATRMGQIVLVVEAGRTTESTLKEALARIESSNVVGALLNKGTAPGASLGGYGYGYSYGYGE